MLSKGSFDGGDGRNGALPGNNSPEQTWRSATLLDEEKGVNEHRKVWFLMAAAYAIPLVGMALALIRELRRRPR
jgi:hypothetical protein